MAGGVAAAFECKVTLRAADVERAIATAIEISRLSRPRKGSPYKELHNPLVYGLLAHSHVWKNEDSLPMLNIAGRLQTWHNAGVNHPREMLDLVCVNDLATFILYKHPYIPDVANTSFSRGPVCTGYSQYQSFERWPERRKNTVAPSIGRFSRRLSLLELCFGIYFKDSLGKTPR